MRRMLLALAVAGCLIAPAPVARADDALKVCQEYAARLALPLLMQSYQFSPWGYGSYGYGPLTYPFGPGAIGAATLFGGPGAPPGTVASYGPLGPGPTALNLLRGVLLPARVSLSSPSSVRVLGPLAALQQGEQINLFLRYLNSALYQEAAAIHAAVYAGEAAVTLENAMLHCTQVMAERQRQAADATEPESPGPAAPPGSP